MRQEMPRPYKFCTRIRERQFIVNRPFTAAGQTHISAHQCTSVHFSARLWTNRARQKHNRTHQKHVSEHQLSSKNRIFSIKNQFSQSCSDAKQSSEVIRRRQKSPEVFRQHSKVIQKSSKMFQKRIRSLQFFDTDFTVSLCLTRITLIHTDSYKHEKYEFFLTTDSH